MFFDQSLFHTFSFVAIFIASVAGSLHCVGMCGGLVALASSSSRGPLGGQLSYNLGRGLGYGTLGALAGAFGDVFTHVVRKLLMPASVWVGVVVVGVLIVGATGLVVHLKRRGDPVVAISGRSVMSGIRSRLASFPFTLGLSTAILPCPWLYSFVLLAAASGTALVGMKVMIAFWLGTLPALLVVGTFCEVSFRALLKRYPYVWVVALLLAFLSSVGAHLAHDHSQHHGTHHNHGGHSHR